MEDFIYEEVNIGGKRRNLSLGIYMKERLHASKRVEVYESDTFGRCLYLDGALQTTEKDECIYHETLVHKALSCIDKLKKVLIIGGGDGGTLREVLKHKCHGLEKVVMVEINPEVIEVSKKFLPTFELEKSLKDPCVELIIGDGADYLSTRKEKDFDAIIVDCSDPSEESEVLYSREFFEFCVLPNLKALGIFAIQAGNVFIKEKFVKKLKYELERFWSVVQYSYIPVPSFPSGGIGFCFATNGHLYEYNNFSEIETKYLTYENFNAGKEIRLKSFNVNNRREGYYSYCKKHFDWEKSLNSAERNFIFEFLGLNGEETGTDGQHNLMSFSQCIRNNFVEEHRMKLITLENQKILKPYIDDVLRSKNINLPNLTVNGFTFTSWGLIEVHFIAPISEIKEYAPLLCAARPAVCFDEAEMSFTFKLNPLIGGSNPLLATRVTFADMTRDYMKTSIGPLEVQRVRTNAELWKKTVGPTGERQIDNLAKDGMILDRVMADRQDFWLTFRV